MRTAVLRETAREKAWAAALKPFLSVYRREKLTSQQRDQIGVLLNFALCEIQLRIRREQHLAASDLARACQNLPSFQPSHLEWPYFRRWFTHFHELHGQRLFNYLAMLETIEQGGQISEENAMTPLGEITPVTHEFIMGSLTMFTRLKDLEHVEFFKKYGEAPMSEAVAYVCSQDYPVVLFGYNHSITFRVTTARTYHLQDGDWTIQFFWRSDEECFHFSLWEGTSKGVVAMPQRVCARSDFGNAIDELIGQIAAGERSQLCDGLSSTLQSIRTTLNGLRLPRFVGQRDPNTRP